MEPADPACPPSSLQTLIGCRKHQSTGRGGCDRERLCAWLLGSRPDLCWPCSLVGLDSGPGPRSQGRSNDPSRLALPWGWRHCNACATLLLFSLPSCPLTYVMSFAGGAGQAWLGPSLSPPLGEARLQSIPRVLSAHCCESSWRGKSRHRRQEARAFCGGREGARVESCGQRSPWGHGNTEGEEVASPGEVGAGQ